MRAGSGIHAISCGCDRCHPPTPADRQPMLPGDRLAILGVAGVATGLATAAIVDRVIGGPGLLAAFGWAVGS